MAGDLREEFLELLGDLREHLKFAKELGVSGFETDFVAEKSEETFPPLKTTAPPTFTAYAPPIQKAAAPKHAQTAPPPRPNSLREKL